MTKADYVRSLGSEVTPAEIMARAEKDGVKLTLGYVYNIRKVTKKQGKKGSAPPKASVAPAPVKRGPGGPRNDVATAAPKRGPGRPPTVAVGNGGVDERTLRSALSAFVVEHGLAAARAIFEDLGARMRAAANG